MNNGCVYDVIIIGAGCAGLTAAIYSGRASLKTLIFCDTLEDKGGLLVKTSIVENFPGFPDGILGFDLVSNMEKQAVNCGAIVRDTKVVSVDFSSQIKTLTDSDGEVFRAKSVIIATGSKPNRLGLPDEDKYWSKGISSCAVCDGALYKKKAIVVVGGGDSAMEEATFLTKFSDVTLIHRGNGFPKASVTMSTRVLSNPKIRIIYNSVLKSLHGNRNLESITIENVNTKETEEIKVDGLFYGLGLKPNTMLFPQSIHKDEDGYITCRGHTTETTQEGVFVAGDAHDKIYRQAIVAAGDGCKAALEAENYLDRTTFQE